jgi:hypothetical protein
MYKHNGIQSFMDSDAILTAPEDRTFLQQTAHIVGAEGHERKPRKVIQVVTDLGEISLIKKKIPNKPKMFEGDKPAQCAEHVCRY